VEGGALVTRRPPDQLRRATMLYAKWYEVVIVIIVLLWVFGQLRGGHGY
jgi:hypothetical protein